MFSCLKLIKNRSKSETTFSWPIFYILLPQELHAMNHLLQIQVRRAFKKVLVLHCSAGSCQPPAAMLPLKFKHNTRNLSFNNLPQVWWLESPGRDILDPGLRWECVFLQGAKTLQTHILSADWVSNSHSWCRHNNFKSEPVPGICGVMPGASAALDLEKFSPEYKLQHDKFAQTKTALDMSLWEFLMLNRGSPGAWKKLFCMFTLSIGVWVSSLQGLQEGGDRKPCKESFGIWSDSLCAITTCRTAFSLLLKTCYLARNTLVAPWGKIIFTGTMTTSTTFLQPAV